MCFFFSCLPVCVYEQVSFYYDQNFEFFRVWQNIYLCVCVRPPTLRPKRAKTHVTNIKMMECVDGNNTIATAAAETAATASLYGCQKENSDVCLPSSLHEHTVYNLHCWILHTASAAVAHVFPPIGIHVGLFRQKEKKNSNNNSKCPRTGKLRTSYQVVEQMNVINFPVVFSLSGNLCKTLKQMLWRAMVCQPSGVW